MSRSKAPSIEESISSFQRNLKEIQAILGALTARFERLEADLERRNLSIQAYTASQDHTRGAATAEAARLPPLETQVSLRSASCASKAERRY